MDLELNAAQNVFLNGLDTKFKAYVGGFGCVHPDTKIHTEHGLMRIADIVEPIRVLSWSEKDQKFQLSLSGGSFPKGRANLHRVVTQEGEFVASGHHRIFSSDHIYLKVEDLCVGDEVATFSPLQEKTIEGFFRLSSSLSVQNYTKKDVNLMGCYADEARRYGQLLHFGQGVDQFCPPLSGDAHTCGRSSGSEGIERADALLVQRSERSRQGQLIGRQNNCRSARQKRYPLSVVADRISALFSGHIFDYLHKAKLSLSRFFPRHSMLKRSSLSCSSCSPIKVTRIVSLEVMEEEELYYDMQVLNTNNYVSEDGVIHHNSGKTFTGCLDQCIFFGNHPGTRQAYFGPSYPAIRDIFYPTMEEASFMMGFRTEIREGNKEVHLYRGRRYYGTTICRSMDRPETIVGFKVARGLADEIDTLKADKADKVWKKMIARLRLNIEGVQNCLGVATTPEGFKFTYNQFKKDPTASYSMVQASTYENEKHLPEDYIESLRESYPTQLIDAYINGDFVNLEGGTVYRQFDRKLNHSSEVENDHERLHIGMDFNVGKMSAIVHIERDGNPIAVREILGCLDTPDIIDEIHRLYPGRKISVYPDSSGKNRKSNDASETDITQLEDQGWSVLYDNVNPRVRDRVNAVNAMFCNGNNERRYMVNTHQCPEYTDDLEQQVYNKQGEPDKEHDTDHTPDAGGYYIAFRFPVIRPISQKAFRWRT